jgi:hypothetical protein
MMTSRAIPFVAAAVLFSIGCGVLLSDAPAGLATICFCLPSIVLLRPSELSRPVPSRQLWITVAVLAALAVSIVLANHFISSSASEQFIRRPVVAGAFWLAMMATLFWRWRRERRPTDA